MLFTPAYAQTVSGAASSATSLLQFAPLLLIGIVFYFLLIRPQQAQRKKLKAMLDAVKRGDRVVTAGGIIGTVKRVPDGTSSEVDVEIAPNVTVSVIRSTITGIVSPVPANDKV